MTVGAKKGPTRRTALGCLLVAVGLVGGVVVVQERLSGPAPFQISHRYAESGVRAPVGGVGLGMMTEIVIRRPVRLLGAEPIQVSPGLQVVAVRAMFQQPGAVSPSGHRTGWAPFGACWPEWPIDGYGESYPVDDLDVVPLDHVAFVLYVRAVRPGRYRAAGIRVRYQVPGHHPVTITGDAIALALESRDPAKRDCPKDWGASPWYATAVPGYPSASPVPRPSGAA